MTLPGLLCAWMAMSGLTAIGAMEVCWKLEPRMDRLWISK